MFTKLQQVLLTIGFNIVENQNEYNNAANFSTSLDYFIYSIDIFIVIK